MTIIVLGFVVFRYGLKQAGVISISQIPFINTRDTIMSLCQWSKP